VVSVPDLGPKINVRKRSLIAALSLKDGRYRVLVLALVNLT
jgi:hypothetical protein